MEREASLRERFLLGLYDAMDRRLPSQQCGFGLSILIEESKRAACPVCRDGKQHSLTIPDNDIRSDSDENQRS